MILITATLLERIYTIVILDCANTVDRTMISGVCNNLEIVTRIALKLNTATFFSISYILFFYCSIVVHDAYIGFVDLIEVGNIDLFCLFLTFRRLFVVAHVKHKWEFVKIAKIALASTVLVREDTTNFAILLLKE